MCTLLHCNTRWAGATNPGRPSPGCHISHNTSPQRSLTPALAAAGPALPGTGAGGGTRIAGQTGRSRGCASACTPAPRSGSQVALAVPLRCFTDTAIHSPAQQPLGAAVVSLLRAASVRWAHRCLGAGGLGARWQAGLGAAEVRQARPALLPLLQGKGAGTSAPKGTDCSHNGMCTFQKAQPKQAACARRAKRGRGQAHHRLEDALARLDGQPADQAGSSDLRPLPLHLCVAGGASLQGRGVRRSMVRQRGGGRRRQGGGRAPCRPRRAAGVAQQQHTSGAPLLDAAAQASGACGRLQAAPERVGP